ncbi:hypothetical protein SAMN05421784_12435 [Xenorhabdus koppenhoeferi]|uniref:Uncharacterized protein n=1 Tax=Xenorhabdus koppenhoeferi TaxID=351659 RepID=A0A1I7IWV2_9GAMM|nr:hypothetical protein SAMN05421784_12435 [Xenorhabdus koppenhoeferi]
MIADYCAGKLNMHKVPQEQVDICQKITVKGCSFYNPLLYSGMFFLVGVPSVQRIPRWTQAETVYSGSAEPDRANTREGNKSNHLADILVHL